MAPLLESDLDDDFVKTISDDDPVEPAPEDAEDSVRETSTKATPNGKKRKRSNETTNDLENVTSNDTSKKSKKNKKGAKATSDATTNGNTQTDEEEDQTWMTGGEDDGAMDSDFEFQIGDLNNGVTEDFDGWGLNDMAPASGVRGDKKGVDIDELIARRRSTKDLNGEAEVVNGKSGDLSEGSKSDPDLEASPDVEAGQDEDEDEDETMAEDGFGMGAFDADEENGSEEVDHEQSSATDSDEEAIADPMPQPEDLAEDMSSADEIDDPIERAKREAFFAPEEKESKSKTKVTGPGSFQSMSLSRPILRGLAAVGFSEPTPIQTKTIPVALLGKDVVGGAVTGSGKTAAFIIPILERLLYRPKKVPTSRVAILMPTRELAVQCFNVAKKLASFTDVTFCQLVGGFSLREQESVLRQRPDVIIATPGRFIDHMRNSASFTVDTLEILVLDEADRMLEDGFADELNEILTTIPKSRQTMLFSATMTDRVDKLIRVGLNRPVRLMVDARKQTVGTLTQEFVRLRPGREDKRLGYLLYLCKEVFTDRVIVFFRQKKEAHRVRIIFGLCGIKATELHGSMSQEQRIASLTSFRTSTHTHLLATDLASRGLDIPTVLTVLNHSTPQSHEIYLHRVGRTARAGRLGRACTIAAEPDRKIVKQCVRAAKAQGAKIVSRVVEPGLADEWCERVDALEFEVEEILKEEKEERLLSGAEMQMRKSENLLEHEDEIKSRPKRTWFESEREKVLAKKKGMVELNGAVGLGVRKGKGEGGKLSRKEKKRLDDGRERVEGRVWKKGKGDERGGRVRDGGGGGGLRGGGGGGRERGGKDGGGSGRKGKGGKEGGGKAKKVQGGGAVRGRGAGGGRGRGRA